MGIHVYVGVENFDELRDSGCYYVDNTELLYELVHGTRNKVTLFTRPRRFGKTLTMRMIESFFNIQKDSRAAFAGLEIMKHAEFCAEQMNRYPVLYLSLKDAEALTFRGAFGKLKIILSEACMAHSYLAGSEAVEAEDLAAFERLRSRTADKEEVQNALRILLRMLHAHYGRPAILLLDEYDVPLAKANEEKEAGERYYPQMLEVIRGLMSAALKSNDSLAFGVVTGCLRISKESIFTGVNNFASYSVLDDEFSRYFGFTQGEVDKLLGEAGLSDKADVFKEWYDGYIFGNEAVYCPWDVINYVSALLRRKTARPKNYWKNTSGNGILRDFIERREFHIEGKFETLMNGGSITQTVSDGLTYDSLHASEENLWSVLLMTGYLSKADPDEEGETVALRIPNKEIASIFQETVARFFSDHLRDAEQKAMMAALWAGDEAASSQAISAFLRQTISYMDYHEDYYHAFLAGIFVGRGYEVESNKERGLGRPDIKLTDWQNHRVILIEAKKSASEAQMPKACEAALQQIVDNEYAKDLEDFTVISYGIAFYRKKALVKKLCVSDSGGGDGLAEVK